MIMGRAGKETAPGESDMALVWSTEGEGGGYRVAAPPLQPVLDVRDHRGGVPGPIHHQGFCYISPDHINRILQAIT